MRPSASVLKLPVPSGFVITTHAYQTYLQHNNIKDILHERTNKLDIRDYEALTVACHDLQKIVRSGQIPEELEGAILDAYKIMCQDAGEENVKVSVRSSALHEDTMASFAGQYKTALNVPPEDLLVQYKNVLPASTHLEPFSITRTEDLRHTKWPWPWECLP